MSWNFINPFTREDVSYKVDSAYEDLLRIACSARPTAGQSGFLVKAAVLTRNGNIVAGGNHEMGITDTMTHGEECALASALEYMGDDEIVALGFVGKGQEGIIPHPCGNCRDAMREYMSADAVILNADSFGGDAVILPLKTYFFDEYRQISKRNVQNKLLSHAFKALMQSYDMYTNGAKLYGAVLDTVGGVFRGSFFGDVAYHPILPVVASIVNNRDGSCDPLRLQWKSLTVVTMHLDESESADFPYVLYKDRQHLLEMVSALRAKGLLQGPLPVHLYTTSLDGAVLGAWETDSDEWLPFPFTPKALGLSFAQEYGIQKLLE